MEELHWFIMEIDLKRDAFYFLWVVRRLLDFAYCVGEGRLHAIHQRRGSTRIELSRCDVWFRSRLSRGSNSSGDINHSGLVDAVDLAMLLAAWG